MMADGTKTYTGFLKIQTRNPWDDKGWLLHTGGDTVRLRPLIDEVLARLDGQRVKFLPDYPTTRGLGLDSASQLVLDNGKGNLRSTTSSSSYNFHTMIGDKLQSATVFPSQRGRHIRVVITPTSFQFDDMEEKAERPRPWR
jgi:hypothetical protein